MGLAAEEELHRGFEELEFHTNRNANGSCWSKRSMGTDAYGTHRVASTRYRAVY